MCWVHFLHSAWISVYIFDAALMGPINHKKRKATSESWRKRPPSSQTIIEVLCSLDSVRWCSETILIAKASTSSPFHVPKEGKRLFLLSLGLLFYILFLLLLLLRRGCCLLLLLYRFGGGSATYVDFLCYLVHVYLNRLFS